MAQKQGHDQIFNILMNEDEITWKTIIINLVKEEGMDPWDVNISLLTQKYIEMIKQLKEMNLSLSGKVILASAMLLKIKSNRLVGEDLNALDQLFTQAEEELAEEDIYDDPTGIYAEAEMFRKEKPYLLPRTPLPRKRKVSIYDLMDALEKALEVKRRRLLNNTPSLKIEIPENKFDISQVMLQMYSKIKSWFKKEKKLSFTNLVPKDGSKQDKVYTFIPLLHLTNQRKIDLEQEKNFGEIEILLRTAQAEKALNEVKT